MLRDEGWNAVPFDRAPPPSGCAAALIDLSGRSPEEAADCVRGVVPFLPVLSIAPRGEWPLLRAAIDAGAADFARTSTPDEITLRLRQILRCSRQPRRDDRALVELAASAGETLEPIGVIRSILGWLQRALPGSDPEVVLGPLSPGGRRRLVRPGPGESLTFSRAELAERPELRRIFEGARWLRLREAEDPEVRVRWDRIRAEGWNDALALSLGAGEPPDSALLVRCRSELSTDDLALVRAAGLLASRALLNARIHNAGERERRRLERAYAERYRELLDANQRLRRLSRQKEELLGIVAHDLRVPLHALLGHARLLLEGGRGDLPTAIRESVEEIRGHAARMFELLDDLLDLHALGTGRLELKPQPIDLAALVREVCDAMRLQASERSVAIEVETPGAPLSLAADPSKLREVFANLIGNAIKFSPPGERVRVRVEGKRDGGGRVIVSDRGPGIPQEMLAGLLADDDRRQGRERARGLGLAIAREITLLHGGSLVAESEVGEGSTFVVELPPQPVQAERPARAALPSSPAPRSSLHRPRVLVVEDDGDVRQLLVDLLADEYEVQEAADGEEAVERAREERPDAILMDLFLPRLDGFGALELLRKDARTADVPVLFLSANRDEAMRVRGLELGAADFVVKPFSQVELKARIARTLRAARQQDQLRAIARTDALTGLPNFRAFCDRLEEELKRSRRYRTPLAAVMIDLDNLKPINDRLGHAAGNRAIVALAEAVTSQLRETDFAARYGGDEFVVLLPHTTAEEAHALAERLRREVHRVELPDAGFRLRASLGVAALAPGSPASADGLVRAADAALYRAKRTGRDRVCVAGEEEAARSVAAEPI